MRNQLDFIANTEIKASQSLRNSQSDLELFSDIGSKEHPLQNLDFRYRAYGNNLFFKILNKYLDSSFSFLEKASRNSSQLLETILIETLENPNLFHCF